MRKTGPLPAALVRHAVDILSVLACVTLMVIVAAAAWLSYRQHSQSERASQLHHAGDMTLVLEVHARGTLSGVDDAVRRIKRSYERDGMRTDLRRVMEDYRDITGYIAVASVADERGRLILSTLPIPPGAAIADLAHFRAHVERDTGEPYINKPVLGRVSGKWSFHVTRRINRADGSFGGVAIVAVDFSYWSRLLQEGSIGSSPAVALIGRDGVARAAHGRAGSAGGMMKADWSFLLRRPGAGSPHGFADGGEGAAGTWAYRSVTGYPLIVAVSVDEDELQQRLGAIRSAYAWGVFAVAMFAILFTAGLLVLLARQRVHAAERLRNAGALQQSEVRLRTIADHVGEGLALYDQEDRLVFCNEPYRRIQVAATADLKPGLKFESLARDRARLLAEMGEITDVEAFVAERMARHRDPTGDAIERRRPDGGYHLIREARTPDGQTVVSFVDITATKRREAALQESEGRFRAMFDHAGIGITLRADHDRHRPWLAVNDKFCEMTGYSREELLHMSTAQITPPEENADAERNNARIARGEIGSYAREKRILRKDGSWMWVAVVVAALPDAEGRPHRVIATYQDINARKLAEDRMRESEGRFKAMFEHAGIGISLRPAHDRALPWIAVNDKFCEMTGYSRDELLRLSTAEITPADGQGEAVRDNRRLLSGEITSYVREKQLLCKDGRRLWVTLSVAALPGADGKPWQIMSTYQDINARKLAEERMRQSEQRFRAMFDHAGVGITLRPVRDRDLPWLEVNDKFCEMTGYSREEALRMSTADITAPERTAGALRDKAGLVSGEIRSYAVEKRIRRKDGSWMWIALSVASLPDAAGKPDMVIATYQDINARKLTEERLRAIIAAEPECVAIVAPDGILLDMNPAGLRMLGAGSLDEMRRWPLLKQIMPGYRRAFVRLQHRILGGESGMLEFEASGIRGKHCWLEIHAAPLRDASGEITALLGIARDVTERRTAREALAAERNLLRTVIDNLPDRIRVKGRDLRYILANTAWMHVRTPGYRDVTGLSNRDLLPREMASAVDAEDRAVLETGRPSLPREVVDGPSGNPRWYVTTKTPLRDGAGGVIGVVAISRDVTDFKRRSMEVEKLNAALEARVAERTAQLTTANEELEAFASSVSHDLRAPLRHIDGLAAVLLEDYADKLDAPGQGYLVRIRAAAVRMANLIEDLLRLSRVTRAELKVADTDLSAIARGLADELRREHPQRVVTFRIAPGLNVRADPGMLRSALANLIHNAWKFTGNKPAATIEFGAMQRDGMTVYFVRDDGAGFDMAQAGRLFDAFQRLHAEHEFPGTGIGLATVRRVMRRHGGDAWAESSPGKGATFFFTLGVRPAGRAAPPEQEVPAGTRHGVPAAPAARPVVLLVDDDPDVLTLSARALASDGYQVLTAEHGEAALAVLREHGVSVVVSDFSMPGMNGAQLLAQVAALHPDTLRIIVSGQIMNRAMQAGLRQGEIHHYFEKQHSYDPVRACIRDWLASARRPAQ